MFAYRTPGVIFEWRDVRSRAIGVLRTDIAGFVGIAERGPLHQPMKVESWTQFTSIFGSYIPQGYLAYAVEGFFANGGQICWIVRVADPAQARPARLTLFDGKGRPTLELTAANRYRGERDRAEAKATCQTTEEYMRWSDPGVWGQKITVSITRSGKDRFSLLLRVANGAPEIWRNLRMDNVECVLNDPLTGSRLVTARRLQPTDSDGAFDQGPSLRAPNLRNGIGRLAGGQDGLAPSVDLNDANGQARLRLIAKRPTVRDEATRVTVQPDQAGRFALIIEQPTAQPESWSNLTVQPPYLDLLDDAHQPTLRLIAATMDAYDLEIVVARPKPTSFDLTIRTLDGRMTEEWKDLSMRPGDPRYVETVINSATGSLLVHARDLVQRSGGLQNPPNPNALNLRNGAGQLGYGPPYLDLLNSDGLPTLRLSALVYAGQGIRVTVTRLDDQGKRFELVLRSPDGTRTETFRDLSMQADDPRYVETVINHGDGQSQLVRAMVLESSASLPDNTPDPARSQQADWTSDRFYATQALNDPRKGSKLVAAYDVQLSSPSLALLDTAGKPTLRLTARDPRGWNTKVAVTRSGNDRFGLKIVSADGQREEIRPDLMMTKTVGKSDEANQDNPRYVETVLNDPQSDSQLVTAHDLASPTKAPGNLPDPAAPNLAAGVGRLEYPNLESGAFVLEGGLAPQHFYREHVDQPWGLAAFERVDEVSIIALPDIMPKPLVLAEQKQPSPPRCDDLTADPPLPPLPDTAPEFPPWFHNDQILWLQRTMIGHCERLKDRFAILDPRIDDTTPERVLRWRDEFDTKYAALYYPWLMAPDPLRLEGLLRALPPSGYVAGIYARVDRQAGVHKPPANEALTGILDIATAYFDRKRLSPLAQRTPYNQPDARDVRGGIDDLIHGDLNDQQVNVIRPYPGRGVRIAGARTLSSDREWLFVNVRRLMIMIGEAIDEQTQWTVFEPNNPDLWLDISRSVSSLLDGLWRRGALDGATAEEAYFVRCDETTNPPEETALGRVICEIGVLPPWPAEFVIVRIGKTESGVEVLETNRI
ncbi:MAG: phage tail sheath subtilisin-like domain-containing protein [Chloroflexales bacterium]|nr:phage tail sheath subtilisin-like domain-containing protein [Chloroflexales bacterium]